MRTIDWIVCIGFLVYMVWTGLRRGREAKSLEGYYAGNRRIPWWAAGLSVMGTQIREEIDIMSIIQFRAISIVVSFNVDARFVGIKISLQGWTGLTGFFRIRLNKS